jgi:hypothetical protein
MMKMRLILLMPLTIIWSKLSLLILRTTPYTDEKKIYVQTPEKESKDQ